MKIASQADLSGALKLCPMPEEATMIQEGLKNGRIVWWRPHPSMEGMQYYVNGSEPNWRGHITDPYHLDLARAIPKEFLIDRWLENDNVRK